MKFLLAFLIFTANINCKSAVENTYYTDNSFKVLSAHLEKENESVYKLKINLFKNGKEYFYENKYYLTIAGQHEVYLVPVKYVLDTEVLLVHMDNSFNVNCIIEDKAYSLQGILTINALHN